MAPSARASKRRTKGAKTKGKDARRAREETRENIAPKSAAPVLTAADIPALVVSVLAPLLLYALTLPRTVVLEDDGIFLMAAAHLGIAHPPGYPLYALIGHLFMQLPFANAAFLGHLSSAALGALACGCVYVCARLMRASPVPAASAALLLGASEHFWSQAIIAEVYALNALLFFATYALVMYAARHPNNRRAWLAAAVVYGLSLANHWPLMVLAFPGLVVAARPAWRTMMRQLPLLSAVSLASAALPYAWMIWRSHQNPLINFRGAFDTFGEVWRFISRQRFSNIDTSPSAGWDDRFAFLQWFANELVWQLTLPGFVLAAVGLAVLFRRRPNYAEAASGVWVFVGNSVVLMLLLAFDFELYKIAIFRPYSLVCYGLAAVWLAVGLQFVLDYVSGASTSTASKKTPPALINAAAKPWFKTVTTTLAGVAALCMVALSLQANWRVNDRADSDFAQNYAQMVFDSLPQDAVLLVFGDMERFVLGYYHYVEQRRPDITLLDVSGLIFANRLYSPHLPQARRMDIMGRFLDSTERPVFYTSGSDFPHGRGQRYYGFLKGVVADGDPLLLQLRPDAVGERYFATLVESESTDLWARLQKNLLLNQYGHYLGFVMLSGDTELLEKTTPMFALAERHLSSLLSMADVLLDHGNRAHWEQIEKWLQKAEPLRGEAMRKTSAAKYFYCKGKLHRQRGEREDAIAAFRKSWDVFAHPDNKSLDELGELGVKI